MAADCPTNNPLAATASPTTQRQEDCGGPSPSCPREAEIKVPNKSEQLDRALNVNEKPDNCYCCALPKGSGLCLPCYTQRLRASVLPQHGQNPPLPASPKN